MNKLFKIKIKSYDRKILIGIEALEVLAGKLLLVRSGTSKGLIIRKTIYRDNPFSTVLDLNKKHLYTGKDLCDWGPHISDLTFELLPTENINDYIPPNHKFETINKI